MENALLRLFKGYIGKKSNKLNEEALKYGVLIPDTASKRIVDEAINQYGRDGQKLNQTFHKSFNVVKNSSIEDLIMQQIIHYITTYGFEDIGIFSSEFVYIPKEKLDIPELTEDIVMISIIPMTKKEVSEKLSVLLSSGIALSEQTVSDVMALSDFIEKNDIDSVKNREVKMALYEKYDIMPQNADEFLRYLILKTAGLTLKIQNKDTFHKIASGDKKMALKMLKTYLEQSPNAYERLSSIFLRNKNLFIAFKIKDHRYLSKEDKIIKNELNKIINKLKKLSLKYHKPLNQNILNSLTNDKILGYTEDELIKELDKTTVFREIRILNGIKYRIEGNLNIMYKIRNGKAFVSELKEKNEELINHLNKNYKIIYNHLIKRLSDSVKNKTVYIPSNVVYTAPTSEKQFLGNIPQGSYIEIPRNSDLLYGIHWKNLDNERVDLDLKQMDSSNIFGWDGDYRDSSRNILFSGDLTDASLPNGATEVFYVNKNYGCGAFLVTLNMYTQNEQPVPFEFIIAKNSNGLENKKRFIVDPNNVLEKIDMVINNTEREKIIGLITISDNVRLYFNNFSIGNARTSSRNRKTSGAFDYLRSYNQIQLKLNDLLVEAGAILTTSPTMPNKSKKTKVDFDLSLNSITKESLIDLLNKKVN